MISLSYAVYTKLKKAVLVKLRNLICSYGWNFLFWLPNNIYVHANILKI